MIDAKTGKAGTIAAAGQPGICGRRRQGQGLRQHRGHERDRRDRRREGGGDQAVLAGRCEGPSGLAMDTKERRLFSVCSNRVMAISDPDTGKVIATPAIGEGSDGVAFDPGTGYAISSNGDGTMTIVQQTGGKYRRREHRDGARRTNDRAGREDAPCLSADGDRRTCRGRRTGDVPAELVQSAGGRQMRTALRDWRSC